MAARVVTIAQQKGGAGKTTLAAHLAISIAGTGKSVAVVDIDPQASLASWFLMRQEVLGDAAGKVGRGSIVHHAVTGWRVGNRVEALAREHDVVIVDSPPHADTEARVAVRAAGLVLIPVQPSPMDVWASKATVDLAAAEGRKALVVLNRVPPRANLTDAMLARLAELDAPLAKTRIGNRVAFASAMLAGNGVTEASPRSSAATEIKALAREVLKAAG